MRTLILGCGNPNRGDDAAGILVALRLRELGVEAREHAGDMLSLLQGWAGYDEVIVIDAMLSGAPAGNVAVFNLRTAELPRGKFRGSTHEFGLTEVVELARSIAQLPPRLVIYGIEVENCEPGGPVSDAVLLAVERVAALIDSGQTRQ